MSECRVREKWRRKRKERCEGVNTLKGDMEEEKGEMEN